jgi:hypothetical protein
MVLYLCVLIVFSLHRELLKLILETNPLLRWFCHNNSLSPKKRWEEETRPCALLLISSRSLSLSTSLYLSSCPSLSCSMLILLARCSSSGSGKAAASSNSSTISSLHDAWRRWAGGSRWRREHGRVRVWRHGGFDGGLPTLPCASASLSHGGARRRLHHHERAATERTGEQQ